ncbi:uncharacterized protein LOC119985486 [Tripterygium wilfordii]|uniref:uncharacterized protein LOC119985486 n=1 Tax=Tripterygium wilfordii TaxID=458696 RepID=UPI0018F804E4|nr:uncharacterized protein LOC119985486 [Tripterygium wilfordii]
MRAIRVKESPLFIVTKFNDIHTHSLDYLNGSHRQASGKVIENCIKGKYDGVGRSSMRRVIIVDGTYLKGKYLRTLFIASALDGNNHIYPIAFAVGDSENNESWIWFFEKLRQAISLNDFSEFAIISYRHQSIEKTSTLVFPESYHGHCMFHIKQNMKAKKFDPTMFSIYLKAAKAYCVFEFEVLMTQLRLIDPHAQSYLLEVGFAKWSRAHFPGRRYNILTTNIAKSMNVVLREAHHLPITMLVEHLRDLLQRWFYEQRTEAASLNSILYKEVDKHLRKRIDRSRRMDVTPISHIEYYVQDRCGNGEVNLHNRTCSCKKFDLQQLPCVHV